MIDCAYRIVGRPQITTDAHKPYLKAVEEAFRGVPTMRSLQGVRGIDDSEHRYSLRHTWDTT